MEGDNDGDKHDEDDENYDGEEGKEVEEGEENKDGEIFIFFFSIFFARNFKCIG